MAIEKVRMTSTGKQANGKSTGTFKVIYRNSRNDKLEVSRFDPRAALFDDKGQLVLNETGEPKIGIHVKFTQKGKLK